MHGEMAKCLSCRHEDPSYIPRTFVKRLDMVMCVCNPSAGGGDRQIAGAHRLASVAYLVSARPVKTLSKISKSG